MLDHAAARLKRRVWLFATRGALAFIGLLLLLAAAVILLVAAFALLADRFSPILAAGLIAGLLIILGLLFLLLAVRSARAESQAPELSGLSSGVIGPVVNLGHSPGSPLRHPAVQAAGIALAVGLLLGRRSKKRSRRRRR